MSFHVIETVPRRWWRSGKRLILVSLVVLAMTLVGGVSVAWFHLRPTPGDWSVRLPVGAMRLEVRASTLIRWATVPAVARHLQGQVIESRVGRLELDTDELSGHLLIRCRPCRLYSKSWGNEAVILPDGLMTVSRDNDELSGTISSGLVQARWNGNVSDQGLALHIDLPSTPVKDVYALFEGAIPELRSAQIEGRVGLEATFDLPSRALTVVPSLEGMKVSGLGTEAWAHAKSQCAQGQTEARLGANSLLARAVIAAEDQRFFEHPGYDLYAINEALQSNQNPGARLRGASTLTQQLAKLLVTGGERSPLRKLRELLYAVEMEQTLGKARILDLYLAHAPWGPQICGATRAASVYFGKPADRLSPAQAAWLAAMLHNPGLELRRWKASGQINRGRAIWVGARMRQLPQKQRARMRAELRGAFQGPPGQAAQPSDSARADVSS